LGSGSVCLWRAGNSARSRLLAGSGRPWSPLGAAAAAKIGRPPKPNGPTTVGCMRGTPTTSAGRSACLAGSLAEVALLRACRISAPQFRKELGYPLQSRLLPIAQFAVGGSQRPRCLRGDQAHHHVGPVPMVIDKRLRRCLRASQAFSLLIFEALHSVRCRVGEILVSPSVGPLDRPPPPSYPRRMPTRRPRSYDGRLSPKNRGYRPTAIREAATGPVIAPVALWPKAVIAVEYVLRGG